MMLEVFTSKYKKVQEEKGKYKRLFKNSNFKILYKPWNIVIEIKWNSRIRMTKYRESDLVRIYIIILSDLKKMFLIKSLWGG